jgi:hypothetical protein
LSRQSRLVAQNKARLISQAGFFFSKLQFITSPQSA